MNYPVYFAALFTVINQKSIAVLPFRNISSDAENEYFTDGMTEELINALSKIEGLKVTARTSSFAYKGKQVDVRHIGNDLGVSTVLEGSIRKAKDSVRITAQLIRTDNGFHIWSESFDRKLEDIFKLQDEVSLLIADKIRENFGHIEIEDHLVDSHTTNMEAYQQFLKGRFYQLNWKLEDFSRAIDFYKLSIRLDSTYYKPYFGLAQCYGILASWNFMDKEEALQETERYLNKGMALTADSAEGFFALATQSFWVNWQIDEALGHLKNALTISPQDTEVLESCAECYTAIGRFEEALNSINQALVNSPLSANHHYTKGNIYYLSGRYDKAVDWMDKALKIDPKWDLAWQIKASCSILQHDKDALYGVIEQYPDITNKSEFLLLFEIRNQGRKATEAEFLRDHTGYLPWEVYIPLYLGEVEKALAALTQGIENRLGQYINFMNDPLLSPLKEHAAFNSLCDSTFPLPNKLISFSKEAPKDPRRLTGTEVDFFTKSLIQVMEQEQPYLQPTLTLRSLADSIHLHPNKLSWLLNEEVGKNFNDFVNGYRIQAFQSQAIDPTNDHLTLLGMAYESGFNSKSVFNDCFKKATGLTPKAWVSRNKS